MAERDLTRTGVEVDSSASPPGCRWAGEAGVETGAARCPHCWFEGRGWGPVYPALDCTSGTSLPSHRRGPTASRRTLPPIPRIAASPSGWPTYPESRRRN